jgi:hypothetical protein
MTILCPSYPCRTSRPSVTFAPHWVIVESVNQQAGEDPRESARNGGRDSRIRGVAAGYNENFEFSFARSQRVAKVTASAGRWTAILWKGGRRWNCGTRNARRSALAQGPFHRGVFAISLALRGQLGIEGSRRNHPGARSGLERADRPSSNRIDEHIGAHSSVLIIVYTNSVMQGRNSLRVGELEFDVLDKATPVLFSHRL